MHVIVALFEIVGLCVLYGVSVKGYIAEFSPAVSAPEVQDFMGNRSQGEQIGFKMGAPVFTLLAHAITLPGLALGASIIWAVIRALDAGFNEGARGPLIVESIDWLIRQLRQQAQRASTRHALGGEREDRVVGPQDSESGLLELHCNRDRGFSDMQAVRYQDLIFRIDGRDEDTVDGRLSYVYRFRALEPWEQVHGKVHSLD